jgi:hypothetical protein
VSSAGLTVLWLAAGIGAATLAGLLAPTAVLFGVIAPAIVAVAGACLWGMRVER